MLYVRNRGKVATSNPSKTYSSPSSQPSISPSSSISSSQAALSISTRSISESAELETQQQLDSREQLKLNSSPILPCDSDNATESKEQIIRVFPDYHSDTVGSDDRRQTIAESGAVTSFKISRAKDDNGAISREIIGANSFTNIELDNQQNSISSVESGGGGGGGGGGDNLAATVNLHQQPHTQQNLQPKYTARATIASTSGVMTG